MRNYFIILFLFGCGLISAQEEPPSKTSNEEKQGLQKKTIQLIDTITVKDVTGDIPRTVVKTTSKDTTVFDLQDITAAKISDSLWLKELYSTDRFEDVYGSITNLTYEVVDYEELPTEVLKQRLEDLNARTPFNVEYNPALESVIKGYLKNRRRTMGKLMALSDYYFPMFEQELDKHNLPLEIKYLAIVESALVPTAKSRVGATGLWQFMYATGKIFGLDVNSYVDDRSDPVKATEAACKYLKSLNKSFNDWDLALAAYNSGPGNVSKAIRRSGGYRNYWNIRSNLPRETAGYLPAFLATMYIFEYAEEHGFKSNGPILPYVATDTIQVKKMISLNQVAEVANIDLKVLEFLNPSYKLGIIPVVKEEVYMLRLPIEAMGKFVTNEEAIYAYAKEEFDKREKPLEKVFTKSDRIRYKVKSGDYLGKIASRYGVGISQIKRWNGLKSTKLKIGQRLIIYPKRL